MKVNTMAPGEQEDKENIFNLDISEIGARGSAVDGKTTKDPTPVSIDIPAFNEPMTTPYTRKRKQSER